MPTRALLAGTGVARRAVLSLGLASLLLACGRSPDAPPAPGAPPPGRHVLLLHLDGIRPDLFRALLEAGRLPHFAVLESRGRISYRAATVDKSETMKVIQAYLTSRLDTRVVGWWQFERDELRFRNFWLDPAGVLEYALGLEFPLHPTLEDFLRHSDRNLVAGMSLARRGVPFDNYARAYLEGGRAVSAHSYYDQAHATMRYFLDLHRRIARDPSEATPALSHLLLAPVDEFSHALGVTVASGDAEHCFERGADGADATPFRLLDERRGRLGPLESRYFTRVERSPVSGRTRELCVELPLLEVASDTGGRRTAQAVERVDRRALPESVLALLLVDMELRELIDTFRSIRFGADGARGYEPAGDLWDDLDAGARGDSLFERTLFIVFGDHGMVDTPRGMEPAGEGPSPGRHPDSLPQHLIEYLNGALGLSSARGRAEIPDEARLGIDPDAQPRRLALPHRDLTWQDAEVRALTSDAIAWSEDFFEEIETALRAELHETYWWLLFLRSLLIDPKLDEAVEPLRERAIDLLAALYLRGDASYVAAEREAASAFYDRHVRLVYGGGARNNAELSLPSCATDACTWAVRPSLAQILAYRGGAGGEQTLIEALRRCPGVGLIFIRERNEAIAPGAPLPEPLSIRVLDPAGNAGTITARRDAPTGELLFAYRAAGDSAADPLGYGEPGHEHPFATYAEWNDRSAGPAGGHLYQNAVAGIGSYLLSDNPAIGDVLVLHATGWNFGGNRGGHGGLHDEEKRTVMLVSGPGIARGELFARSRYRTRPDGSLAEDAAGRHHPTLLDVTPTALAWLGYPDDALPDFARDGFEEYLREWTASQRQDILDHLGGAAAVERALAEAGFDDLRIEQFRGRLARLLRVVAPVESPQLPRARPTLDGLRLILTEE